MEVEGRELDQGIEPEEAGGADTGRVEGALEASAELQRVGRDGEIALDTDLQARERGVESELCAAVSHPGVDLLVLSDNVAVEFPQTEFVRPCNLCPHMKRITLPKILRALETLQYPVVVEPAVAEKARRAVERMLHVAERLTQ